MRIITLIPLFLFAILSLSHSTDNVSSDEQDTDDFIRQTLNQYSDEGYHIHGVYSVHKIDECNLIAIKKPSRKQLSVDYCINETINIPNHSLMFDIGSRFFILKDSYNEIIVGPIDLQPNENQESQTLRG